jgi:cysteinyl-tRNA synthetase
MALGCLPPSHQPRATDFVLPRPDGKADMATLIQRLIERGHAYEAKGEILFDTASMADYGQLSKRNLDEQQAGARVAVEAHKKNPQDFVLWKESSAEEPGWDASFALPGGKAVTIRGRPGWHIECSAMAEAYLGEVFDIHGGGLDLIFPHHENEIAQSRCAHGTDVMANYWMHNGFLQVEGRKMSKSEGNFVTINELLETEKFGGRKWPGEVLRLAMLMTHYREPIDFSVRRLEEAERTLLRFFRKIKAFDLAMQADHIASAGTGYGEVRQEVVEALADDLNVGSAISALHDLRFDAEVEAALRLLGIDWRSYLRAVKAESGNAIAAEIIKEHVDRRLSLIHEKNWAEADRIRDELLAQGIQLKDGKDPVTGERVTTWEVKR